MDKWRLKWYKLRIYIPGFLYIDNKGQNWLACHLSEVLQRLARLLTEELAEVAGIFESQGIPDLLVALLREER